MMTKIPYTLAIKTMLVLSGLVLIFHGLVLASVIPYDIVWGGQLQNDQQMQGLELVSIAVNLTIILVIAIKAGYVRSHLPPRAIDFLIWVFAILFAINSIGNLLAQNTLETLLFTPLTVISAILCVRIAIEKRVIDQN